ncbi:MAG TPA: RecX family transcriptional regulator [Rectinemataceae bacterium]|nr:RecX family transcriptional regulator [Rectinemataceae bacterium]
MKIESVKLGASGTATVAAGGSSFLVRLSLLGELGLEPSTLVPGAELGELEGGLLALAAEVHEAEKRGLALLARAEQSAWMLRAKLETRGLSPRAVKIALGRLSASGILDDARFAAAYAAARLARRAEGPASLAAALRAKGLDGETVKAAVTAAFGQVAAPEERRLALEKAAARELKRSKGDEGLARSRLRALGYKSAEIAELFGEGDGAP